MRRSVNCTLHSLWLLFVVHAATAATAQFVWAPAEDQTAALVAEVAARQHYRSRPLDQKLCDEILERFLLSLDWNRDVFTAEDIAAFYATRNALCAAFEGAGLSPLFALFEVFRSRLAERVAKADELLAMDWDFNVDESLLVRGSTASWAAGRDELDEIWRKRIKNDQLSLILSGRSRAEAVEILRTRYSQLEARAEMLGATGLFQQFVNAYVGSLDPHSEYFLPLRAQRKGRNRTALEGLGVQLKVDREYVAIKRIFDGSAADRSGRLHVGDRILAVGEGGGGPFVDVVGWPLDPVVDLIRGPIGSTVRLQVVPKGAGAEEGVDAFTLARDRIDLRELTARMSCEEAHDLRLCIIAIPRFHIDYAGYGRGEPDYAGTATDVARLINQSRLQRPVDGILLDLRGNPGGALLEAARLAGLFIDSGPIVQVKHASGKNELFSDPLPGVLYDGPLAVLIDRYSASATEIFAAAIQDYRRGVVLGERTYGKGTVQETFDLGDPGNGTFGHLALTTAEYFRVTGQSTQLAGVEPDLRLPAWPGARKFGERFEINPLLPGQMTAVEFEPAAAAALVTRAVRERQLERLQNDPALRVMHTAQDWADGDSSISLNEQQRRVARERLAARRNALDRALRSAVENPQRERAAGQTTEQFWRDLTQREATRTLADLIQAAE